MKHIYLIRCKHSSKGASYVNNVFAFNDKEQAKTYLSGEMTSYLKNDGWEDTTTVHEHNQGIWKFESVVDGTKFTRRYDIEIINLY